MSRVRRCAELRCHEPVVGRASRCPKHQAERAAVAADNQRHYQLAAEMLHSRRLPEHDAQRATDVADEFAALVVVWDACLGLRPAVDALPMKAMEPLGIAQNQLAERCVWRAMRLRAYVLDSEMPPGREDATRLSAEVQALAARVRQAGLEDRRRRGWPT